MKKLSNEIQKLNKDTEFVELMSSEEDDQKYINTVKHIEYKKGIKQVASNMIKNNIDIKTISKVTGLSEKEIEKL